MHELSLCQGIIDTLETEARRQHFCRVRTVRLEVGALAGVDVDALSFAWEAISPGTLAEQARLAIISVPGSAWCQNCERAIDIAQYYDPCPHCQDHKLRITGGEQLKIRELEVE